MKNEDASFKLVTQEYFHEIKCDFYKDEGDNIYMTSAQLGECLEYANPKESISKICQRHEYLLSSEFSGEVNLTSPSGTQKTRVFSEYGIYDITMLSKTSRAQEFRLWVAKLLRQLRFGHMEIIERGEFVRSENGISMDMDKAEYIGQVVLKAIERYDNHQREKARLETEGAINYLPLTSEMISKCSELLKSRLDSLNGKESWGFGYSYLSAKRIILGKLNALNWEDLKQCDFDKAIEEINKYEI